MTDRYAPIRVHKFELRPLYTWKAEGIPDNHSRRTSMSDYMDGWNAGLNEGCNRKACLEIASRFPGTVDDIVAAAEKFYAFVQAPAAPETADAA